MDQSTNRSILVVEDDQYLRELYQLQFEQNGIAVTVAAGGKEALAKVKSIHFDAILLDIMMPDLTGIDVIKVLKQDPATKNIPVIFLTNMGQENIVKEGMALGAIAYLIKSSYLPDQLIKKVTEILSKYNPSAAA
jgi:two-component system phosphate regulon response regulator PhoB